MHKNCMQCVCLHVRESVDNIHIQSTWTCDKVMADGNAENKDWKLPLFWPFGLNPLTIWINFYKNCSNGFDDMSDINIELLKDPVRVFILSKSIHLYSTIGIEQKEEAQYSLHSFFKIRLTANHRLELIILGVKKYTISLGKIVSLWLCRRESTFPPGRQSYIRRSDRTNLECSTFSKWYYRSRDQFVARTG